MDLSLLAHHLWLLTVAYVLALPIAWNREVDDRTAGLRTFPLVAVSSCGYMLCTKSFLGDSPEAQARILQGLITGIGFVGGGAILKTDDRVSGTSTAASIWSTGAIGAAVAFQRYEIGIVLTAINFATFKWLTALKPHKDETEQRAGGGKGETGESSNAS